MKVSLVHPQAKMPVYGSSKAAGMDLHACESVEVAAKGESPTSSRAVRSQARLWWPPA